MVRYSRNLVLDVFDYTNHKLCTIYDNSTNTSGQAYDVFILTERNGWRELSFNLPSTINTEGGTEPNFRLDYIKSNYRIRAIDDDGTDWFLITEPSFKHSGEGKDVSVKAGHISQLLKTKNLGLIFSDDEGNNVGTAAELLTTILDGTGWSVGNVTTFYEKDGTTIKRRSLIAGAKTGAFKLIASMCNLFNAKPVYHGDTKTVDIVPMNPFSKPQDEGLPDVTQADGVIELAYSKNISNVTRSENSENLATKLYAYGSYGDVEHGYCGIDECVHTEHVFTISAALSANTTYWFSYTDNSGLTCKRHFKTDRAIPSGSKIIYSTLDPASQMYVWVVSPSIATFGNIHSLCWEDIPNIEWNQVAARTNVNGFAYFVYDLQSGTQIPVSSYKEEKVQNWFSFLMDLEFFRDINLLTSDGLQKIAGYQRFAANCHELIYMKSLEMSESLLTLSETIGDVDFCKLDVTSVTENSGMLQLTLNKTTHPDGVIYRSDFTRNTKEHFKWNVSPEIKTNGDPKTSGASMLFIVHNTNPVTWTKGYLKAMDNKDDPSELTFHIKYDSSYSTSRPTDKFFLFGSNNINGNLGALEIENEANSTAIDTKTKVVTVNHYVKYGKTLPTIVKIEESTVPDYAPEWYKIDGYGWFWKYSDTYSTPSELYFCYYDHYGSNTERVWRRVYFQAIEPSTASNNQYWYNWRNSVLYRRVSGQWTALDSSAEQKVAAMFGPVYKACRTHDQIYKGEYENYTYTAPSNGLTAGNYFISGDYDDYHVFTLKSALSQGDTLSYNTKDNWIVQIKNGTMEPIQADLTMEAGTINLIGELVDDTTKCRSAQYISVQTGANYSFTGLSGAYPLNVYQYNSSYEYVGKIEHLSGYDGTFETDTSVAYIKLTCDVFYQIFNTFTSFKILNGAKQVIETKTYRFDNVNYPENSSYSDAVIIIQEEEYTKLSPATKNGELTGIITMTKKFADTADLAYEDNYDALVTAQNTLADMDASVANSLGDMYREGYWQKKDYVNGDETKLYDDALDVIKEISHPKVSYNISYLDRYGSDMEPDYGVSDLTTATRWPDLSVMSAAHLIDEEINVNCWAYMDKLNKCYDKPWKTQISINTDLSVMPQHSFQDIMSSIADVANAVKAKEELIDRAGNITNQGMYSASKLQGAIDAAKLAIFGGASTWYTDEKGNMVFESANGKAAMTLTGSGFAIASSKDEWGDWNWRTCGTGEGLAADAVTTGYLSADRIEAGSIGVSKVTSDFGAYLDISENGAITSIVTTQMRVFTQWDDPANEPDNHVKDGDIWVQDNKIRTWGTPGPGATEYQAAHYTWSALSAYPWDSFLGTKSFVRKNNRWVVLADMSTVVQQETKIEQNAKQIQLTADSVTVTNETVQQNHAEFLMTSEAITQRVENTEGDVSQLTLTSNGLVHEVYDNDGSVAVLRNDVNGLEHEVNDDNGKVSVLRNDVNGLEHDVYDNDGRVSILSNSVDGLKHEVYDSDGSVSVLSHSVDGLQSTVSSIQADYASKDYVNSNNFTYTQWEDPVITETRRNIIAGDLWIQTNGVRTWSQMSRFKWGDVGSTDYDTYASAYKWQDFMGPIMKVRENNQWVTNMDLAEVTINQTKIEQTNQAITLLATKEEIVNGVPKVLNSAVVIDINGVSMRGGTIEMNAGTSININAGSTFAVNSGNFNIDESGNVTMAGSVTSASGTIGGWTLASDKLYSGSNTSYVALDSKTTDTYAIWAGNATAANAPFSVQRNGSIKSTSGTIGGWTIGANTLSSGSDTNYVQMATSGDYAFLAGDETVSSAPFRVKRDGTVYLTKLIAVSEQGGETSVDLTNYPFWKLDYRTVKSLYSNVNGSTVTITLETSNGNLTTNFTKPGVGQIVLNGAGQSDFNADGYAPGDDPSHSSPIVSTKGYMYLPTGPFTRSTPACVGRQNGSGVIANLDLGSYWDAAYASGETAGASAVTLSGAWDGTKYKVTASNGKENESQVVQVTRVPNSGPYSSHHVYVRLFTSGQILDDTQYVDATPEYNAGYTTGEAAGESAVTLSGAWNGTAYKVTASNGKENESQSVQVTRVPNTSAVSSHRVYVRLFTSSQILDDTQYVDATPEYNAGSTAAKAAVTLTQGGWLNGSNIVSANNANGQTTTVNLPTITLSGATAAWVSHKKTIYASGGGASNVASVEVDATSEYNAGATAAKAGVTLTQGGWLNGSNIVSANNANGQTTTVNLPTITLSAGSTWVSHKKTVYASGGGASNVASIEVDATAQYTAGQNSVSVTKGTWSSGQISFSPSAGTGASKTVSLSQGTVTWDGNTASVPVLDGSGSTGYTCTVNAYARYKAGNNDAYANQTVVGTCYTITAHSGEWVKVQAIGTGYSRVAYIN